MFVVIGVPVFWIAVRLPPRGYRVLAYPMLIIATVLLLAVLIPGIGVMAYGARRWIDFGPLQFQPSEFGKLAILVWAADLLGRKQHLGTLSRARQVFLPLVPVFVIFCALVMREPDLGTTMCFILILVGLLWMVGLPLRYFAPAAARRRRCRHRPRSVRALSAAAVAHVSAPVRPAQRSRIPDRGRALRFGVRRSVRGWSRQRNVEVQLGSQRQHGTTSTR